MISASYRITKPAGFQQEGFLFALRWILSSCFPHITGFRVRSRSRLDRPWQYAPKRAQEWSLWFAPHIHFPLSLERSLQPFPRRHNSSAGFPDWSTLIRLHGTLVISDKMLTYNVSGLGGKKTSRGQLFVNTVSITEIFANRFQYFSDKKSVRFLLDRKSTPLRNGPKKCRYFKGF